MRALKALAIAALALSTTACTAVIYPMPVVHHVPVYRTHTVVYPEVYYFHNRPVIVHRHRHHYSPHPHWGRW